MTRQDLIIKWIAYITALVLTAAVNYYALSGAPIALPLLLPGLTVAAGTLEGPAFGAIYGGLAGMMMVGLGHEGMGCIPAASAVGWLSGLVTQYVLRRDLLGHMLCCAATAVCWELWQVGSRYLTGVAELEVLLRVALPELGWTMALAIPVYWVGLFCCAHFGRIYHE